MRGVSDRAALIPPDAENHRPGAKIAAFLRAQAQVQTLRWRMWAPVAFGGGCASYFTLKAEPSAWPLVLAAVIAVGAWQAVKRAGEGRAWTLPLMLLACFVLGGAVAKLRTDAVAAPIAPAMSAPTVIEGWVIDVDSPGSAGPRVVIAPVRIRGLTPEQTPERLRATVRGAIPEPGDAIRVFGILNPPPAPASPGAYDFGRNAYFQSLGGVAFGLGEPREAHLASPPWRVRAEMAVNGVRFDLARRIVERLGPRTGGVAAAMTKGTKPGWTPRWSTSCAIPDWRTSCRSRACTWPWSAASPSS